MCIGADNKDPSTDWQLEASNFVISHASSRVADATNKHTSISSYFFKDRFDALFEKEGSRVEHSDIINGLEIYSHFVKQWVDEKSNNYLNHLYLYKSDISSIKLVVPKIYDVSPGL